MRWGLEDRDGIGSRFEYRWIDIIERVGTFVTVVLAAGVAGSALLGSHVSTWLVVVLVLVLVLVVVVVVVVVVTRQELFAFVEEIHCVCLYLFLCLVDRGVKEE